MALIDRFASTVHHVADAIPLTLVVAVNATMPWWREWLLSVSEVATLAGQLAAVALAAYKILQAVREGRRPGNEAPGAAGHMAAAAKSAGTAKGGIVAAALVALLGVGAFLFATTKRADASPALPPAGPPAARTGRKRQADDDAGDLGDVEPENDGTPSGLKWYALAHGYIGTAEELRGRSNPKVSAMFAAVGMSEKTDARKVPWCAVFVNYVLERAGIPGTKQALARSFLAWGDKVEHPRRGDVVVFFRGKYDDGTYGHVGFVERVIGDYVYCLGGNQGDAVSVARFHASRVLGYRRPRSAASLRTSNAAGASALFGGTGVTLGEIAPDASTAQKLIEAVAPVQSSLRELAGYLPMAGRVCAGIGVALAIYAAWRRVKDFRSRGI